MEKLFANIGDPDQMQNVASVYTACQLPFRGLQTKMG